MKTSGRIFNMLLFMMLASSFFTKAIGQSCYVIKDSIIADSGAGSFTDYVYSGTTLGDAYYTDSGSVSPSRAVKAYYNSASGMLEKMDFFNTNGTPVLFRVIQYTITNNKVTSVYDSTDNSTTTHTVSYDGNGNISSVILSNSTGSPGFPGSFSDFVWQNGNITSLNLLFGTDTLELTVTTDSKNNVKKKLLPTEGASDIFQIATNNNITEVTFVNDEVVGGNSIPAGSYAIQQQYTYNSNNDVVTRVSLPSAFDNKNFTTQYVYDCTLGILNAQATPISIYPNPATDIIRLEQGNFKGVVKIFDVTGKIIRTETADNLSVLNISELISGIYYIEITKGQETYRGKVLKN